METGLPADDGAGTGIPAGNGMRTGLSRTFPLVILNFPHVILSEAKDLLSPAACQRNGEKDPSSAPPPQDDRAEARHAYLAESSHE